MGVRGVQVAQSEHEVAQVAVGQPVVDAHGAGDGVEHPVDLQRVGDAHLAADLVDEGPQELLLPFDAVQLPAGQAVALPDVGECLLAVHGVGPRLEAPPLLGVVGVLGHGDGHPADRVGE